MGRLISGVYIFCHECTPWVLRSYFSNAHPHRNDNSGCAAPRPGVWPEVLEHLAWCAGALGVPSLEMACFIMLIRVVSLVGSALAMDAIIGAGVRVSSRVRERDAVPCSTNHTALWICSKVYKSLGKWSGNLSWSWWATLVQSFCGKPQAKARHCSAVEIWFFTIRKVVIAINSLWYFPKSASDENPALEFSPTSFSISPIGQCLLASDPRYNLYTTSTNCW